MMHFGFSYVGLIFLLLLFIPNLIWAKNPPAGYEQLAAGENKGLLILERIGEVLASTIVLIFSDFNWRTPSLWSLWLLAAGVCMVLYEAFWIRYFCSQKALSDFYTSLLGIPLAGATLPVAAFLFLGIYGRNLPLIIADILLGIGHIGIHWNHKKEL